MQYFRSLSAMSRKAFYPLVPLFPPGQDLSWIPDGANYLTTAGLIGTINGINTIFVCSNTNPVITRNGVVQKQGVDYTILSPIEPFTISFVIPPEPGDILMELSSTIGVANGPVSFANVISSADMPDGTRVNFTFSAPPRFLIYNGQLLVPPSDFTVTGDVATMPVAPESGAELFAII